MVAAGRGRRRLSTKKTSSRRRRGRPMKRPFRDHFATIWSLSGRTADHLVAFMSRWRPLRDHLSAFRSSSFTSFCRVILIIFVDFYHILLSFTVIYRVLPISHEFYKIWSCLTVFYRGLPSRPTLNYCWFRLSNELNERMNNSVFFWWIRKQHNTKQHNKEQHNSGWRHEKLLLQINYSFIWRHPLFNVWGQCF